MDNFLVHDYFHSDKSIPFIIIKLRKVHLSIFPKERKEKKTQAKTTKEFLILITNCLESPATAPKT